MTPAEIKQRLKTAAMEAGFDGFGIAPADVIPRRDYLQGWLESGRAGDMHYLARNLIERADPATVMPSARSVMVLTRNYHQPRPDQTQRPDGMHEPPTGKVAQYAWGRDYHKVMKKKTFKLLDRVREETGITLHARVCVDTAPILEREFAAMAGVGWIGKNTLVLNEALGSYTFLAVTLLETPLPPDAPAIDHCGQCTACLDACPTGAFPSPYEMDASRCLSYLTIEHRTEIPAEFHGKMEGWLFGCDICQEVCPFNRKAPVTNEADFSPRAPGPEVNLHDVLAWDDETYNRIMAGSAAKRATLAMWKRNARALLPSTD